MKYHKIGYFMIDFGERVLKPMTIDQYSYFQEEVLMGRISNKLITSQPFRSYMQLSS